eukprot:g11302.t1
MFSLCFKCQPNPSNLQDDELEVDSDEEGKAQTSTVKILTKHARNQGFLEEAPAEADSLDKYMSDLTKKAPGEKEMGCSWHEKTGRQGNDESEDAGMGVMDSSRVKSITLEEIEALMRPSSEDGRPLDRKEKPETEQEGGSSSSAAPGPAVAAASPAESPPAADDDDEDFHAAFIAEMRKLRGEDGDAFAKDFEASKKWLGERPGFVFKRGKKGLGYYRDVGPFGLMKEKPGSSGDTRKSDLPDFRRVKKAKRKRREAKEAEAKAKADAAKKRARDGFGEGDGDWMESDPDRSEQSSEEQMESYFDLVKRFTTKKTLPAVNHDLIDYKSFRKNLYVQVKEITNMKDHEVEDLRRTHGDITVRGKRCPHPVKSFLQCGLPEKILKIMEKREYETPFPIQMQAMPALMCGRDVIGVAQTGSGKTIAYLLPLIRHIMDQPPLANGDGPVGFVVAPTRELALQIQREANTFCKAVNLTSVCAYGGGPMGEQLSALKKGRIGADRMFDMGFEPQIGMFLQSTRPDKQVAMFSATLPAHVEALARKVLKKPLEISVGERNAVATNVTQFVEVLDESQKFYRLLQLLGEWHEHGAIIIFVHQQKDRKLGQASAGAASVAREEDDFKDPWLEPDKPKKGKGKGKRREEEAEQSKSADPADTVAQAAKERELPKAAKLIPDEFFAEGLELEMNSCRSQLLQCEALRKKVYRDLGDELEDKVWENLKVNLREEVMDALKDTLENEEEIFEEDEEYEEEEEDLEDELQKDKELDQKAAREVEAVTSKFPSLTADAKQRAEREAANGIEVPTNGSAGLQPPPPAAPKAKSFARKSDKELQEQARQMAEDTLKSLPEEAGEKQLPALTEKLVAKLRKVEQEKVVEAAALAKVPAPPPVEEILGTSALLIKEAKEPEPSPVMKAIPLVPGVLGQGLTYVSLMLSTPSLLGQSRFECQVTKAIESLQSHAATPGAGTSHLAEEKAAKMLGQNKDIPAGMHSDELEINDYPQIARQKITHRD